MGRGIQTSKPVPPPGMFIFSKATTIPDSLLEWEQDFNAKGIKTKRIQDDRGYWYLCREGIEAVNTGDTKLRYPNKDARMRGSSK